MQGLTTTRARLALLSLALVFSACNQATTPEPGAEPQAVQPESFDLVATGTSFEFVPQVEAEPVTITTTNEGDAPAAVFFARLNEGVSPDEVREAFETEGEEAGLALITPAGTTPETAPGQTTSLTIQFPEGSYLALGEGDEEPAVFEVTAATGPDVAEPDADAEVEMGEFYFDVKAEIGAGESTLLLTNAGEQGHEFTGAPGTPDEVFGKAAGNGEEPEGAFFSVAPAPGGKLWFTHEFEAGPVSYACFFPDPESGKPHFKLGMEGSITVA
jgi:hypothetical protein